ncbi:hypothetical protein RJT34_24083 [Clitoria ternatea]|uniref:Uncharacterized protein n=1 Tax=Clitoria ternatea TaxID=43366 RepID=A0AAN9IIY5_CLITE
MVPSREGSSVGEGRESTSGALVKIEVVAKKLNFRVTGKKEFAVRMQGDEEGRKGKLAMKVEVFEVAVVKFSKSAGDTQR